MENKDYKYKIWFNFHVLVRLQYLHIKKARHGAFFKIVQLNDNP